MTHFSRNFLFWRGPGIGVPKSLKINLKNDKSEGWEDGMK
jgi:hypothetical protein